MLSEHTVSARASNQVQPVARQASQHAPEKKTAEKKEAAAIEEKYYPEGAECPITRVVMKDPRVAADGHSYEADAIAVWFVNSNKSPLTGKRLSDTTLRKNFALTGVMESAAKRIKKLEEEKAKAESDLKELKKELEREKERSYQAIAERELEHELACQSLARIRQESELALGALQQRRLPLTLPSVSESSAEPTRRPKLPLFLPPTTGLSQPTLSINRSSVARERKQDGNEAKEGVSFEELELGLERANQTLAEAVALVSRDAERMDTPALCSKFLSAVRRGDVAEVKSLLTKRIDVNIADEEIRETALMKAVQLHKKDPAKGKEMLFLLCEAKADLEQVNCKGNSALHYAAGLNDEWVVMFLLSRGADSSRGNCKQITPAEYCIVKNPDDYNSHIIRSLTMMKYITRSQPRPAAESSGLQRYSSFSHGGGTHGPGRAPSERIGSRGVVSQAVFSPHSFLQGAQEVSHGPGRAISHAILSPRG